MERDSGCSKQVFTSRTNINLYLGTKGFCLYEDSGLEAELKLAEALFPELEFVGRSVEQIQAVRAFLANHSRVKNNGIPYLIACGLPPGFGKTTFFQQLLNFVKVKENQCILQQPSRIHEGFTPAEVEHLASAQYIRIAINQNVTLIPPDASTFAKALSIALEQQIRSKLLLPSYTSEEYCNLKRLGLPSVIDAYPEFTFFIHWDCLEAFESTQYDHYYGWSPDPSTKDYDLQNSLTRYRDFWEIVRPLLWHPRCFVCCCGNSTALSVMGFKSSAVEDLPSQTLFVNLPTLSSEDIKSIAQHTVFPKGNTIQQEFSWSDEVLDKISLKLYGLTQGIPRLVRLGFVYLYYKIFIAHDDIQEPLENEEDMMIIHRQFVLPELVRLYLPWRRIYVYLMAMFLLNIPFSCKDEIDFEGSKIPLWILAHKVNVPLRVYQSSELEKRWIPTFSIWSVDQFIGSSNNGHFGINQGFLKILRSFITIPTKFHLESREMFLKTVVKSYLQNASETTWDSVFYFLQDTELKGEPYLPENFTCSYQGLDSSSAPVTDLYHLVHDITICLSFKSMQDQFGVCFISSEINRFQETLGTERGILVIVSTGLLHKDIKVYFPQEEEFAKLEPGRYDLQKGRLVRKRKNSCLLDVPENIRVFILFRPGLMKVIKEREVILLEHLMRNSSIIIWQACFQYFLVSEKAMENNHLHRQIGKQRNEIDENDDSRDEGEGEGEGASKDNDTVEIKHISVIHKESGEVLLQHLGISPDIKFKHIIGDLRVNNSSNFVYIWEVNKKLYSNAVNAFDVLEDEATILLSIRPKLDILDLYSTVFND
ncbi:hypothetical protein K7432_003288 [Basidiobolus ranarum]|uniref:Uncharacterized protein n=1 Tax=Basidiobolus ranarum TaxID=34480 RepID=A0ABR2W6H3_9FUNG